MNAILAIPLSLRLAVLFALGALVGSVVNLGAYRLAWHRRWISPWTAPPDGVPRRHWADRLPIVGWLLLAREVPLHGRGFWIRPLLAEIVTGLLFAIMYLCDTEWAAPFALVPQPAPPRADFLTSNLVLAAHLRYLSHALAVSLMLVASLIDLDEKTIPDAVTVPGALLGLVLAAIYPWSLPAAGYWQLDGATSVEFLTAVAPEPWPDALTGLPARTGLAIALGAWTLWCGGLLPRRWNTRRGWRTATRIFLHRLRVEAITYRIGAMWLLGAAAVALAAWRLRDSHWAGLLTALVGLAVGGGLVWVVRVVGTAALRREAMGFGDVTLMSMIGAFVGWQPAMVIFFLAPFAGLVVGVMQWIAHGEREIPYGPFLCLAAFFVIVDWPLVWDRLFPMFAMGQLLLAVLVVCMALMGLMLLAYRTLLTYFTRPR